MTKWTLIILGLVTFCQSASANPYLEDRLNRFPRRNAPVPDNFVAATGNDDTSQAGSKPEIPGKWLKKYDGWLEALEIQKQTGADIFLYIQKMQPKNEKGLCRWWEKNAMNSSKVRDATDDMIKVQLSLPGKDDVEQLVTRFRSNSGPILRIVPLKGRPESIRPFEYVSKKPQLKNPDIIAQEITELRAAMRKKQEDREQNQRDFKEGSTRWEQQDTQAPDGLDAE